MIFLTTTAIEVDEELLNRCLVLSVCEEREQTKKIHRLQRDRQTLEGLLARQDRKDILKVHQDAQRLLRPLLVTNPYAPSLTFLDNQTRTRRDHMKYLTLIRTIALLHQYQRSLQRVSHNGKAVQYIEVSKQDIQVANNLAHEVLGRSLDELAPQTRRLLILLDGMVTKKCEESEMERCDVRFSRRGIREFTGWSYDQVRVHVGRLVELEYLLVHSGGRGQSFVYELVYDGKAESDKAHFMGLIDTKILGSETTTKSLGGKTMEFGGGLGPHLASIGGSLGGDENQQNPLPDNELEETKPQNIKNALKWKEKETRSSYVMIMAFHYVK